MSRIAPQEREPVEIAPRRKLSPKQRLQVLLNGAGKCYKCRQKICDAFEVEHPVPHALGGSDKIEDLRPICKDCHSPKSKADVAQIAKAKRQSKLRLDVERTVSPSWRGSRPFNPPVRVLAKSKRREG